MLALLAVLVAGLLRSHAEILRALHGLGVDLDPHTPEAPERGRVHAGARARSSAATDVPNRPGRGAVSTSPAPRPATTR